jgi:hypothetical protein
MRLDNVDPDTRFWLDRHGIKYDGLLFDEDKYEVLAHTVDAERVIMVVDDLSEQCVAAGHWFGQDTVAMYANSHNEWVASALRHTHRQLERLVEQRVSQWRRRHERETLDTPGESVLG